MIPWILLALRTRAQFNLNNHLTGGSARPRTLWTREAVVPNLGFWGNLGLLSHRMASAHESGRKLLGSLRSHRRP